MIKLGVVEEEKFTKIISELWEMLLRVDIKGHSFT
jgi:hypothetical protein